MGTCVNCKYVGRPTYKSPCSECSSLTHNKYEAVEIRTNGDRIRAMSDEGLAAWIATVTVTAMVKILDKAGVSCKEEETAIKETAYGTLEWLKQPVEEVKE